MEPRHVARLRYTHLNCIISKFLRRFLKPIAGTSSFTTHISIRDMEFRFPESQPEEGRATPCNDCGNDHDDDNNVITVMMIIIRMKLMITSILLL